MTEAFGLPEDQIPNPIASNGLGIAAETILTLDDLIEGARLPERIVRISKRGDLLAELDDVEGRLEELVDDEGQQQVSDDALGAVNEVHQLRNRAFELRTEIAKSTIPVKVRAMGAAAWKVFFAKWEDTKAGGVKDGINDALVIACTVSPVIESQAQLDRLKDAFNHVQVLRIAQAAFAANTASGLDLPKLPPSLAAQQEQGRS